MTELVKRHLPDVLKMAQGGTATSDQWARRRKEIQELLEKELFGVLPELPLTWRCEMEREEKTYYQGGKALIRLMRMEVTVAGKPFAWRFYYTLPKKDQPVPLFLQIAFTPRLPISMLPIEEICDGGYGLAAFDYQEVTTDDGDFTNGLAGLFYPEGSRGAHAGGKIALWAWAAMRVMDYLVTVPEIDPGKIYVVGHSRLGKTALWAGGLDERFAGVIAIQSGCGGAAIARGNTGEKVADITRQFPFWFAPAYAQYAGREEAMPFDQHFLLALVAPRKLYVASAAGDAWADPTGELLSCQAVTPVYELWGCRGLQAPAACPADVILHEGQVAYHRRPGTHFFSRLDWQRLMAYFDQEEA